MMFDGVVARRVGGLRQGCGCAISGRGSAPGPGWGVRPRPRRGLTRPLDPAWNPRTPRTTLRAGMALIRTRARNSWYFMMFDGVVARRVGGLRQGCGCDISGRGSAPGPGWGVRPRPRRGLTRPLDPAGNPRTPRTTLRAGMALIRTCAKQLVLHDVRRSRRAQGRWAAAGRRVRHQRAGLCPCTPLGVRPRPRRGLTRPLDPAGNPRTPRTGRRAWCGVLEDVRRGRRAQGRWDAAGLRVRHQRAGLCPCTPLGRPPQTPPGAYAPLDPAGNPRTPRAGRRGCGRAAGATPAGGALPWTPLGRCPETRRAVAAPWETDRELTQV
jgi:hypothetical protein